MKFVVMVLIPAEYGRPGVTRWVEADSIDASKRPNYARSKANSRARALFEFGYSPSPGEFYRVQAAVVGRVPA